MRFAQVVFPERLPRSSGFFDYEIPKHLEKEISAGVLVSAPFRSSEKNGVVFHVTNESSIPKNRLKKISGFVDHEVITPAQFKLIEWLRGATGSSYGTIVRSMLPQKPKRLSYALYKTQKQKTASSKKIVTEGIFVGTQTDEAKQIKEIVSSSKMSIIIVPDLYQANIVKKIVPRDYSTVYTGDMNTTAKFTAWENIRRGKSRIVIGTRNALLLPLHEIDTIILTDESNLTHQRTDQHPDIDTRTLALFISKLYGANLIFTGATLTVETYNHLQQSHSAIKRIKRKKMPAISVIDTNLFTQKRQSPILPDDLQAFLSNPKLHAFLLYNRKGYYRRIFCSECGWEPSCDVCSNAFISEKNEPGELECRVCGTKKEISITCPQCANPNIRFTYPGIEEIHRRLQIALPNQTVSLLTKERQEDPNAHIVLGTVFALPYVRWDTLQACILLDTDISLNFPDFRSSEWFLHRLEYIYSLLPDSAKLFLLTKQPHHRTLEAFIQHMPDEWYRHELQERKKLHYPPYAQFFKFNRQEKNEHVGERETKVLLASLEKYLISKNLKGSATRLEPIPTHSSKGFHYTILLRIIDTLNQKILAQLYEAAGPEWTIKQNPLDLFS